MKIPFYGNPDDTHCLQCSLKMILGRDFPDREWSWEQLEELTGKRPGKWTSTTRGLIEMKKLGYETVNWREYDYDRFARLGEEYWLERFGPEKCAALVEHYDIPYEMDCARELQSLLETRQGLPDLDDMQEMLRQGYLIVCNVNSKALNGKPGFAGHYVLVYEMNDTEIVMHDPGPPPRKARRESKEQFSRAWEYPSGKERNITAFRSA